MDRDRHHRLLSIHAGYGHVLHSQLDLDENVPYDSLSEHCRLCWHALASQLDTDHVLGNFSQHGVLQYLLAGHRQAAKIGEEQPPGPNPKKHKRVNDLHFKEVSCLKNGKPLIRNTQIYIIYSPGARHNK